MYKLNGQEKVCIKTIARRVRTDYLKKNNYTYFEDDIDIVDEGLLISNENVEDTFITKIEGEICANELEKIFQDFNMVKSIKVLTDREKLVLFLYHFKGLTDENIGEIINLKGDSTRKLRKRAQDKVKKQYKKLEGDLEDDF